MNLLTLKGYFVDQIKDLYNAESQLLKALPKMEAAATEESLQDAFREYKRGTECRMERLKGVLERMEEKVSAVRCDAMAGIIKESEDTLNTRANDMVRDVALIASARRIAHYQIAGYDVVVSMGRQFAPVGVVLELEKTQLEASAADDTFKKIAEGGWFTKGVNDEAGDYDEKYRDASREGGKQSPLEDWTKSELQKRATELEIDGRSSMDKNELVGAIREHQ